MSALRTLLVDDSPAFLQAVMNFLSADSALGSTVDVVGCAGSGQEALEQVESLHPDLVLMDWAMPGMNGVEALRRLKMQAGCPRLVMISGHSSPSYRSQALQAGADGYVVKEELGSLLSPLLAELRNGDRRQGIWPKLREDSLDSGVTSIP